MATEITKPVIQIGANIPSYTRQYIKSRILSCYKQSTNSEIIPPNIWVGFYDEAKAKYEVESEKNDGIKGENNNGNEARDENYNKNRKLDQEGYIITAEQCSKTIILTSKSLQGILYAIADLDREIKLRMPAWSDLSIISKPSFSYRHIWLWGRPKIGTGFFDFIKMKNAHKENRYKEFADMLIRMKLNTISFWGRTGEGNSPEDKLISEAYANFSSFLKNNFGIKLLLFATYELSERFGFDIWKDIVQESKGSLLCVHNPVVHEYWEKKINRLYERIPDLGGLLMAGAGGDWIRGPWECKCHKCRKHTHRELLIKAINMIATPLKKHGGILVYKNVTDRPTLVPKEVELFSNLQGLIPDNVLISHKNYYKDFRPVHPYNPMFFNLEPSYPGEILPYITEFQIFGEYRGSNQFPAVMTKLWSPQFRLAKSISETGVMAIASECEDMDHLINSANWYTFGELAWNPQADPDTLLKEWAQLKFGEKAASAGAKVADLSIKASTKMMFMKGIMTQNHSNLPSINYELESSFCGPWHDIPRCIEGYMGRGHDLSPYPKEIRDMYVNDPDLILFTSRIPIAKELVHEGIAEKDEAISLVQTMIDTWEEAKPSVDSDTFENIYKGLRQNLVDAKLFRESVYLYLMYKSGELTPEKLKEKIDLLKTYLIKDEGSKLIKPELLQNLISEWEEIYNGTFKRRVMEGKYHAPPTSHFPPGLKK